MGEMGEMKVVTDGRRRLVLQILKKLERWVGEDSRRRIRLIKLTVLLPRVHICMMTTLPIMR